MADSTKKETMTGKTEPPVTEGTTAPDKDPSPNEAGPKKVKIKLFKDNDRYKDDVFVSVNGENYQIQRGVEVEVPDYIAEVLEHAEEQRKNTALTIERLQSK